MAKPISASSLPPAPTMPPMSAALSRSYATSLPVVLQTMKSNWISSATKGHSVHWSFKRSFSEEVIQFIEAKEAGKRSTGRLQEAQSLNAARSQYRQAKQEGLKSQHSTNKETCHYCGQNGHGKHAPKSIRKNACPAYGKTCGHCGRPNHIEAV